MATKKYFDTIYDVKTWLTLHIGQLSYTRNLIITLTLATLGYTMSNFPSFKMPYAYIAYLFLFIALVFLCLSIYFGLKVAIDESENYRVKRSISRDIAADITNENDEFDRGKIETKESETTTLENINKVNTKKQFGFFIAGFCLIALIMFFSQVKIVV